MPRTRSALATTFIMFMLVALTGSTASAQTPPPFLLEWGGPGSGDGQFNIPVCVATDAAGNVYVTDIADNRIQKFTDTGTYLTQWGSPGSGNGQFEGARGIATDANGNVYISDTGNSRIQKFDGTGTYLTQWGSFGSGNGQFSIPYGVATDAAGNVYVVDSGNSRIQKFTGTGTYLTQWGSFGSGDGRFYGPTLVATDAAGNVYVADTSNQRIQKFTDTGTYLTQWGSFGGGGGHFNSLVGVATDAAGNVYVADDEANRIQKFTGTGSYLTQWGSFGSGDGQFNGPFGVATDAAGDVYVVDRGNHRIQKFGLGPLDLQGCDTLTVNEGAQICCTYTASDPNGGLITLSASGLPPGATFQDLGNASGVLCWTPGFSDAGTYHVIVTASNGTASTSLTTVIKVAGVNRAPTANPGGPYSGVASVPVALDGSSSSDPDGNTMVFDWDFENDGVYDATSARQTHTYPADGVYTLKLRVTDDAPPNPGVPALSDSATTTATIQSFFPARVFRIKTNKIQLYTDGQHHCFQIEPIGGDFALSDVNLSTVVMRYGAIQVSAETGKTTIHADTDHNGIAEIQTCFSAVALRTLFVAAPIGVSTVTVGLEGDLTTGGRFHGSVSFKIQKDDNTQHASVSPNPLNPEATLSLFLPKPGFVRVKMYDLKGRLVRTVMEESDAAAGYHDVRIDGRGAAGEKLASGVYFYHVETAAGVTTGRFVVMK